MTAPKPKPYDRQPQETDKSWVAFCMYRDMGRDRSLEKTLQKYPENTPKSYLTVIKRWCRKYKWVERCRFFDSEELERESIALRDTRLKRRLLMEEKAWKKSLKFETKAEKVLSIPVTKSIVTPEGATLNPTDKWSLRDAIALDEYAHKLAIFATGGDRPNMTEIDAVRVLAQAGMLPAEILEAAERGGDALKSMLTEAFQNLNKPTVDS